MVTFRLGTHAPREKLCNKFHINKISGYGDTIVRLDKKRVFGVRLTNPTAFVKILS